MRHSCSGAVRCSQNVTNMTFFVAFRTIDRMTKKTWEWLIPSCQHEMDAHMYECPNVDCNYGSKKVQTVVSVEANPLGPPGRVWPIIHGWRHNALHSSETEAVLVWYFQRVPDRTNQLQRESDWWGCCTHFFLNHGSSKSGTDDENKTKNWSMWRVQTGQGKLSSCAARILVMSLMSMHAL